MTHRHLTDMQRERITRDRMLIANITDAADARMRERTAKEQLAMALAELDRGQDDVIPDADDGAAWAGVLR